MSYGAMIGDNRKFLIFQGSHYQLKAVKIKFKKIRCIVISGEENARELV